MPICLTPILVMLFHAFVLYPSSVYSVGLSKKTAIFEVPNCDSGQIEHPKACSPTKSTTVSAQITIIPPLLTSPFLSSHLTVQIIPNSTLQPLCSLSQHLRQIIQVISCRDTKLPHKVLSRTLQIPIILFRVLFLPSKVGVRRNGTCTLKTLQTLLGFRLCVRVEGALAEELVAGNAFLGAEFLAGVFLGVVCFVKLVYEI